MSRAAHRADGLTAIFNVEEFFVGGLAKPHNLALRQVRARRRVAGFR
jgi:hypothetical protein